MNDSNKAILMLLSPVPACVIVMIMGMVFIEAMTGLVLCIIVYTCGMFLVWRHPRVRHYNKASDQWAKNYRYVKGEK